ncbi:MULTISPECIES: amidohydrolase family protein [unclassified Beijerinckia]|uniref:amidohydrolase family protein n=1 Tax=unclassified Beijerinckia TaxID=2638183 RepID=UPI00089B26B6|nr:MULTISPECIES: amidohydrolase family protein [unclassified Beijerinckia]MDH7798364.1 5-methylthioadenosine/S-adenosylhomocysteine deaminase [Beijerinckia sp. GAS462]SED18450.1 5-methylthioadenosine/S-adenosylhomocysteine deaminase [Beijerinckia sp. 28-YEA-48]
MTRILIKNGYVVTVNGNRDVWPGGAVAVADGQIQSVQASAVSLHERDFDEVIDAQGCLVMPGLINAHQHHWYSLFKGMADGLLLEDWISDLVFPLVQHLSNDAMRVASYQCGMEMLATGTTCSFNHSVTVTTPDTVKAIIEPQAELGIRQVFGKELRCRNPRFTAHPLSLDESLAALKEDVERWNGARDGLVRMGMVIEANAHWTSSGMSTEDLILRGAELARTLDLRISSHIAAGTFSMEKGFLQHLRQTGRTDVRYLMQLGVLDHRWLLAHCIHCTELDLEQMAHVGASLIYTPTSEAIRGGGLAPVANASDLGINTALGTDGPMVDYSDDMFEQIKACVLFQHQRHLDPTRMPVERAVEMATIDAAHALGLDQEIGSLDVGKQADIAIFDMRRPHVGPLQRPLSAFVCAGKGSDAKAVLVAGQIVYRDGQFSNGPDPREVLNEAERVGADIARRAGLADRMASPWPLQRATAQPADQPAQ